MLVFVTLYLFALLMADVLLMLLARLFWVFDIFINFVPQFLILGVISLVLLLTQGYTLQAGIMCCALLYFARPVWRLWKPHAPRVHTAKSSLTILQANVNQFNTGYASLGKQIRETDPTMIFLNEVREGWLTRIKQEFGDRYGGSIEVPADNYRGMGFFSKLPIASYEIIRLSQANSPLLRIQMKDMPLTVYATHPVPPMTPGWASQRKAFFRYLISDMHKVAGDILMVGDLNTTIFSPLLVSFLKSTGLTLDREGFGLRTTWLRGTPLAMPLDHILYRGALQMRDFRVLGPIGSDHRPVLATFNYAR